MAVEKIIDITQRSRTRMEEEQERWRRCISAAKHSKKTFSTLFTINIEKA